MFIIILWKNCSVDCLKQFPFNFSLALSKTKLIVVVRLLSDAAKDLIVSGDNPLDFHDKIYCVSVWNIAY